MNINFNWYEYPIDKTAKQRIEEDIIDGIEGYYSKLISVPVKVNLVNDVLNSVITGAVLDKDNNQILKITIYPLRGNETVFEIPQDKK